MKVIYSISVILVWILQAYTQGVKEVKICMLLKVRDTSMESRVLDRVERIIKRYDLKKEKFYVDIVFSENGDTILHFSKYSGFERDSNNQCGILKGKEMTFDVLYDVKEVRNFFHLKQVGTIEKKIYWEEYERKKFNKIRKHLDIYVYKSYDENKEMLYVIFFEYNKCKMPSIDELKIVDKNFKKKRYCNCAY